MSSSMVARAVEAEALALLREPGRYLEVSCNGRAIICDAEGAAIDSISDDVWLRLLESGAIQESEEWCSVFLLSCSAKEAS